LDDILGADADGDLVNSPKRIIPGDMGAVAYFLDTEKNVMGVWSMK
jgi:predicted enzyme related to lactoylglutathione lyase